MANVPDDSKEYFSQENLPEPTPPGINIVPTPTGSQVEDGSLRSSNYRTGSSGWSINSDGTAEFVGLEATNIVTTQSYPVSETMSAGTPVGVDWEGKIARAMRNFPDDATNQFTYTGISYGGILGIFPYARNTFVVVYEVTITTSDYFKAVIATVDPNTNNITFGTPTTIDSNSANFYTEASACQIDTGTFVVGVGTQAGAESIYAVAFTYNGSSFSVGAVKTISTDNNYSWFFCCKANTSVFAYLAFSAAGVTTHGYCSVSGTTITVVAADTTNISNITSTGATGFRMAQIGTNKVAIMQGTTGYIAIATTNGSWVVGTAVDLFDTAGDWTTSSIVSPAEDTFFAHLGAKTGYFTVSGTVPSLQGSLVARTGSEGGMVLHNGVVYDLQTNPTDDQNAGLWSVTQAGSSAVLTQLSSGKKISSVYLVSSDGYRMFALCSADLSYWISSMSYNFIGFLQDGATTTSGHNGRVVVRGIVDGLTGLVAGSYYLVSNGALTRISPIETVNTLDDVVNVVKAISSTQILV